MDAMQLPGGKDVAAGWKYWTIALCAALWNVLGCLDYWRTMTRDTYWLAAKPPQFFDWLDAAPDWFLAAWGFGVGMAMAGALLLLIRSEWAVAVFALSLADLAICQFYRWQSGAPPGKVIGSVMSAASAMSPLYLIVAAGLLWFVARSRRRGVLE